MADDEEAIDRRGKAPTSRDESHPELRTTQGAPAQQWGAEVAASVEADGARQLEASEPRDRSSLAAGRTRGVAFRTLERLLASSRNRYLRYPAAHAVISTLGGFGPSREQVQL